MGVPVRNTTRALLADKTNSGFTINSPVNGEIHEINRGEKRALVSIVIKKTNDDSIAFDQAKMPAYGTVLERGLSIEFHI